MHKHIMTLHKVYGQNFLFWNTQDKMKNLGVIPWKPMNNVKPIKYYGKSYKDCPGL